MTSVTVLRGFKVSATVLDAFLDANQVKETHGLPSFQHYHPDRDGASKLLHSKILKAGGNSEKEKFRIVMPFRNGHSPSTVAYITYDWFSLFAHRKLNLENDLPDEVPIGFEELRSEILSFSDAIDQINNIPDNGQMGTYMVHIDSPYGAFKPQEKLERLKIPQHCDQCAMEFHGEGLGAFEARQIHRKEVHGSKEGTEPMPNE